MKKVLLILIVSVFTLSSCMVTKTYVGDYKVAPGREYNYASGKQFWLVWGIVPIGRTNVETPKNGNCEVKTHYDFVDFIISAITGGFVSSYTIDVKAKQI